jgi:phosphopantothenoylcysteine synthetase/decarboxylase
MMRLQKTKRLHALFSTQPPLPASSQIDNDDDDLGYTRNFARRTGSTGFPVASAASSMGTSMHLHTPPNSFVDPNAFNAAFERHYKEMQNQFQAGDLATSPTGAVAASEDRGPLQEALRMMRGENEAAAAAPIADIPTEADFDKG